MESKILNDFCFHKPKTLDEALVLIDKYQETGCSWKAAPRSSRT